MINNKYYVIVLLFPDYFFTGVIVNVIAIIVKGSTLVVYIMLVSLISLFLLFLPICTADVAKGPKVTDKVSLIFITFVVLLQYFCYINNNNGYFEYYFSREHIALSYKRWCGHRIRKNKQIKSTAHDGKSYLK